MPAVERLDEEAFHAAGKARCAIPPKALACGSAAG
jgi:hypothetical protein